MQVSLSLCPKPNEDEPVLIIKDRPWEVAAGKISKSSEGFILVLAQLWSMQVKTAFVWNQPSHPAETVAPSGV